MLPSLPPQEVVDPDARKLDATEGSDPPRRSASSPEELCGGEKGKGEGKRGETMTKEALAGRRHAPGGGSDSRRGAVGGGLASRRQEPPSRPSGGSRGKKLQELTIGYMQDSPVWLTVE